MSKIPGLHRIFRHPFRRHRLRSDIDAEIAFHLEMKTQKLIASGLAPEVARDEARRRFGSVTHAKAECWRIGRRRAARARAALVFDERYQDVGFALREFGRRPGFTAVAVLTLGLGIGASTAMFTVVDAVLVRPLPYHDPGRLVVARETIQGQTVYVAPRNFVEWQRRTTMFEGLAVGFEDVAEAFVLTGDDEPLDIRAARVSRDLFALLGVEPIHGRTFRPEEFEPGQDGVVVLSEGLWERRFGADEAVIGRQIVLSDRSYTVIGVMASSFEFPERGIEVWRPMALSEGELQRIGHIIPYVTARLKPGVTVEQARQELQAIAAQLAKENPQRNAGWGTEMAPMLDYLVGNMRPALLVLLGAVGLVLVIAIANVSGLLLTRAIERRREMAVRRALGAGRWRLIRQLLTEGLILGLAGAATGLLAAYGGVQLLLAFAPEGLPRMHQLAIDGGALGYAVGVTLLAVIICSLVPAWRVSGLHPVEALKATMVIAGLGRASSRMVVFGWRVLPRHVFVIAQTAMSLLLLIGAGLLIRTFAALQQVDPGFEAENVLMAKVELPHSRYPGRAHWAEFFQRLIEETEGLPQVRSAGIGFPVGEGFYYPDMEIEGAAPGQPTVTGGFTTHWVTPGYFRTMGIPLLRGRTFSASDRVRDFTGQFWLDASFVAIVNEAMAKRDFPGGSPIGKLITRGTSSHRIVGVVGDVKELGLHTAAPAQVYFPFYQIPVSSVGLYLRTETDPLDQVAAVRERLWAIDADQPIELFETMDAVLAESMARQRFSMVLMAVFAALALALAAGGIFGVTSYAVARRTQEFGIRRALGARASGVFHLVLFEGLRLSLAGLAVGLVAALWLTRLIASELYGVTPTDPMTFVVVCAVLVGVALLASYVPARRATRADPMTSLRCE